MEQLAIAVRKFGSADRKLASLSVAKRPGGKPGPAKYEVAIAIAVSFFAGQ
jgi:hypothetical protein